MRRRKLDISEIERGEDRSRRPRSRRKDRGKRGIPSKRPRSRDPTNTMSPRRGRRTRRRSRGGTSRRRGGRGSTRDDITKKEAKSILREAEKESEETQRENKDAEKEKQYERYNAVRHGQDKGEAPPEDRRRNPLTTGHKRSEAAD